jgi:hypothetical protein
VLGVLVFHLGLLSSTGRCREASARTSHDGVRRVAVAIKQVVQCG